MSFLKFISNYLSFLKFILNYLSFVKFILFDESIDFLFLFLFKVESWNICLDYILNKY